MLQAKIISLCHNILTGLVRTLQPYREAMMAAHQIERQEANQLHRALCRNMVRQEPDMCNMELTAVYFLHTSTNKYDIRSIGLVHGYHSSCRHAEPT